MTENSGYNKSTGKRPKRAGFDDPAGAADSAGRRSFPAPPSLPSRRTAKRGRTRRAPDFRRTFSAVLLFLGRFSVSQKFRKGITNE
ncbi:MAG: hypothetical protein DBY36_03575 [Clostridiales bacterium]|nr:MAG: hypothetical protein DBY36_03575 [Clostridiales bacterium]